MAALAPNLYGLLEFVYNPGERPATWYTPAIHAQNGVIQIPDAPGLGINYDAGIWKTVEWMMRASE